MCRRLAYLTCLAVATALIPAGAARAELIGWWTFNEGAGTTVADAAGNGHDGTINGNPVWAAGTLGGALQFDGAGDYVMCNLLDIDTAVTGGITVCGWLNRPAGGDRKICSNRQVANAAGGGFSCSIYNDRLEMDISNATVRALARDAGGPAVPANAWVHLAWVYDDVGNTFKEYHDGVLVDSDAVTVSIGLSTAPFRIGADSPSLGLYYTGLMDDWRVYDHALSEGEVRDAMAGKKPDGELASEPKPAHEATEVLREAVLSWSSSKFAAAHDVYLGTVEADVDAADRDHPGSVLVSVGQTDTTYKPTARLELGQTYFWRIDEVNAAPDNMIFKGRIWSFKVELRSYPIQNVLATASGSSSVDTGPEKTVDGSGLSVDGLHSDLSDDMWLSSTSSPGTAWIQYEFDDAYKLDKLLVWNFNQKVESFIGFGAKNVTIEHSVDGAAWATLGDFEFTQAQGLVDYAADTTVDLAGAVAKYVKLTINGNWGGLTEQYGLSEVRFFSVPVAAREPDPVDGAADVGPEPILSWRAGREADSHLVYLSTDQQAVIDGTAPVATVSQAQYDAVVDLGQTYYWKVVEVNEAETPASWTGPVWSFSVRPAIVVDDFEAYTDDKDADETIYQTWIDGWDAPGANGAIVGHDESPFAEQVIIHGGKQSMPLAYSNSSAPYSQAERTLGGAQDWTLYGLKSLSLMFYGDPANTGQLYVKINNGKVAYPGPSDDLKKTQWQAWHIDLAATGANLKSVTKLAIGIDGANASGMLYIDDIRLYPNVAALTAPVDPGTAGLRAWYKFDGDLKDAAGTNHGVAVGDAKTAADAARGQVLALDGAGDGVDVPSLGSTESLTIAIWANTSVDPVPFDFASLFHCDGWAAGDLHWRYSYGKVNAGINGVAGGDLGGLSIVEAGQWNHVAVTVSPTEWTLWLNGIKEASRTLTAPAAVTLGDGLIGAWVGTDNVTISRGFTGQLDDARFYNRALSQEEIVWLAGRTSSFYKPF